MIPAALVGILAINRLGAVHAVVFGGFAAGALAQRIDGSRPAAILTASCGIIDGSRPPVPTGPSSTAPSRCRRGSRPGPSCGKREQLLWEPLRPEAGERSWQDLVADARDRDVRAGCVPVKSTDGIYIIYTSGTTAYPKAYSARLAATPLDFTVHQPPLWHPRSW